MWESLNFVASANEQFFHMIHNLAGIRLAFEEDFRRSTSLQTTCFGARIKKQALGAP